MHPGMFVRSFRGNEGEIYVPGLGAKVGIFSSWTLKRREENSAGTPHWTLHGVLSYQNEALLKNPVLSKRMTLVMNKETTFELCSYETLRLEGSSLLVEGVVQCPSP